MSKLIIAAVAAGLLTVASAAAAADHEKMHALMGSGAPMADDRAQLNLPDAMKVMQKRMMRQHLDTVSDLAEALAASDLARASSIAKGLGWSPEEEQRCNKVAAMTGEKDFVGYGMAVHKSADELAAAADSGDRDKALAILARLIRNCNACHERFRH